MATLSAYPKTAIFNEASHQPSFSATHEQGHQGLVAQLAAPVAVHFRIEGGAGRQGVGRVKMIAPAEHATAAVLQTDLHVAVQNEDPLVVNRAMELTAKARWAVAQLVAARSHQGRELTLRRALGQRDCFLAKFGAAIGVGEENGFFEISHTGQSEEDQVREKIRLWLRRRSRFALSWLGSCQRPSEKPTRLGRA